MVFFFEASDGHVIYMGKDKYENEDLIKFGLPTDIWFHVDDLSSAHVYLRLRGEETFDDIPPHLVQECCQLTKANSIEGSKASTVTIVYTPWQNLNKRQEMEVGAIGFHKDNLRKYVKEVKKDREIIKALIKTKQELYPNLDELQQEYHRQIILQNKEKIRKEKEIQKLQEKENKIKSEQLDYKLMDDPTLKTSNKDVDPDDDDDFM